MTPTFYKSDPHSKPKRPVTVWIAQGLLIFFNLIWLVTFILSLVALARNGFDALRLRIVIGGLLLIGYGLVLLIAFWGLAKRRVYGKWLAVVSLSFIWLIFLYAQLRRFQGPYRYYEYENTAEVVGAVIGAVAISSLFLIVILRLAFAKSVARFFKHDETIVPEQPLT